MIWEAAEMNAPIARVYGNRRRASIGPPGVNTRGRIRVLLTASARGALLQWISTTSNAPEDVDSRSHNFGATAKRRGPAALGKRRTVTRSPGWVVDRLGPCVRTS